MAAQEERASGHFDSNVERSQPRELSCVLLPTGCDTKAPGGVLRSEEVLPTHSLYG